MGLISASNIRPGFWLLAALSASACAVEDVVPDSGSAAGAAGFAGAGQGMAGAGAGTGASLAAGATSAGASNSAGAANDGTAGAGVAAGAEATAGMATGGATSGAGGLGVAGANTAGANNAGMENAAAGTPAIAGSAGDGSNNGGGAGESTDVPLAGVAGTAGDPADMAGASAMGGSGADEGEAGSAGGGSMVQGEIIFSEDFEGTAPGSVPDGWETFIGWVPNPASNSTSGAEYALADATRAHGGSQAAHIKGAGNPGQLVKTIGGFETLYVRAWIYSSVQIGNNTSGSANHETLIALRHEPGSANDEIRFGEIKGAIGTNEVPTDDIAPTQDQWNSGPSMPANEWVCVEVAFLADKPYHELHAWANGELVHEITAVGDWQNGSLTSATWLDDAANPADDQIVFGWHSFSSVTNELWVDDIVVATGPIGCD